MKKYLMILVAMVCFGISANAIVFRGTNKFCGGGAELTLYSTGKMVFYDSGKSYSGTYKADDGYIQLYDENGTRIISCRYKYSNNTLHWIELGSVEMKPCK